ncbi:hypothetical protein ACTFIR_000030 [Dictyostelium discoideum]
MNLFWNIVPVHKDDPVFIHNMLYRRDFYKYFVSHIRANSVIHFDIESNYQNHFLKNIRNNENYNNINQNNEDGGDGEWDGDDSSDDSDNYDDTYQGENHVEEEEEEEELERDQVYPLDYIREQSYRFPVMVPIDCLLTKKKLIIPAKFVFCQHFQCFELRAFIKNSCRTGCWKCPVCSIGGDPFKLIIDNCTAGINEYAARHLLVYIFDNPPEFEMRRYVMATQDLNNIKKLETSLPPPENSEFESDKGGPIIVMLWVSMFMVMEHHSRDQCGDDNFFHFNSCADKKS